MRVIAIAGFLCVGLLASCKGDTYGGPTSILVTSEPSGASILLDDKEAGFTPARIEVEPAHNHTLRISFAGRHTVRATINRAYNDWNYPGGGTAVTLYASLCSGPMAPLTAIVFSPLIGVDAVYAVPYLLRSAESEPLPPGVHAVLPPVAPGEEVKVIEWRDEGRAERLGATRKAARGPIPPEPASPTPPMSKSVTTVPATSASRPAYSPRVTP